MYVGVHTKVRLRVFLHLYDVPLLLYSCLYVECVYAYMKKLYVGVHGNFT